MGKIARHHGGVTSPVHPFRRNVTIKEMEIIKLHYPLHTVSGVVDANGNIHLTIGGQETAHFHINENDLNKLL